MIFNCECCNQEFELHQVELKEKYLGAMITKLYYSCPRCRDEKLICITNTKTREMTRKVKRKIKYYNENDKAIMNTLNLSSYDLIEMIKEEQKELKEAMNKLNGK